MKLWKINKFKRIYLLKSVSCVTACVCPYLDVYYLLYHAWRLSFYWFIYYVFFQCLLIWHGIILVVLLAYIFAVTNSLFCVFIKNLYWQCWQPPVSSRLLKLYKSNCFMQSCRCLVTDYSSFLSWKWLNTKMTWISGRNDKTFNFVGIHWPEM